MKEFELKAMISLLDDPDQEVFQQIEQGLISCGPEVIYLLEQSWESTKDLLTQTRIENIIHKIQLDQIRNDLQLWALNNQEDLLEGLIIINRYQYPNLDEDEIHFKLAEMRRELWIQLMYDMSPLEKVKLLNNVLFKDFGFSGNTLNYHDPQNSYINKVIETKKGNPISLTCIYSILAQRLDIPIFGVNLPKHFIATYVDDNTDQPLFYINIFNRGQIMKEDDITSFLTQINVPNTSMYTQPCSNMDIIKRVLRNLITAYDQTGEIVKKDEISSLLNLLNDEQ